MSAPDLSALQWIKSSYSANQGTCVEIAFMPDDARWIKSSYSTNNGTCVEIAAITGAVAARDSKNPGGPVLVFGPAAFGSFLQAIRSGAFDRPSTS